jgi:hypothetical protein
MLYERLTTSLIVANPYQSLPLEYCGPLQSCRPPELQTTVKLPSLVSFSRSGPCYIPAACTAIPVLLVCSLLLAAFYELEMARISP